MKVDMVIGAAYGDECKGNSVDYLSQHPKGRHVCVVRANGSAMAGHTVKIGHTTHIFSHFGAGTFNGATTYLAEEFVVHPMLFMKELNALRLIFALPKFPVKDFEVLVNSKCYVTTPWDMLINQFTESNRGANRHGSCGVGFHETIERCNAETPGIPLTVSFFFLEEEELRKKLISIRDQWGEYRIRQLGLRLTQEQHNLFYSDSVLENFISDCYGFMNHVKVVPTMMLSTFDHLVFEGAQGLMLDQYFGQFPHVTRSCTGLNNPMKVIKELDKYTIIEEINVHYITRTYTTRHGAGWFPFELTMPGVLPFPNIVDTTNVSGPWQGDLRFSYINFDNLKLAIQHDINTYADDRVNVSGIMTCCDQVSGQVLGIKNGRVVNFGNDECGLYNIIREYSEIVGKQILTSFGPTKTTMGLFTF